METKNVSEVVKAPKFIRPSKDIYYLEIAKAVSLRSTCLKNKCGVVIVKDDIVVSTGYNGSPRGWDNCIDKGFCPRLTVASGTSYESCDACHGEWNALINASHDELKHAIMYIYQFDAVHNCVRKNAGCCRTCRFMIINSGIAEVIFADPDGIRFDPNYGYGVRIQQVHDWVETQNRDPIA